jgi:ABC-type branched-subunit amino acid transport system substrate-binding protein
MPFFANDQDSDMVVSSKSLISLEFLEGMKMAAEDYRASNPLQLDLVAWDVRRDSSLAKKILRDEAKDQEFDVIVGSYFNNESRVIADWAEANQITHIVPFSPESYLAQDKEAVYLASPSLKTHAVKMADYAVKFQNYKKLIVFTSDDRFTSLLAEAFIKRAEENKAVVIVKKYVSNPDKAQTQIPELVKQISQLGVDAVYIPSSNEEMVSLIISHMRFHKIQATILGSPEFRNFRALDKELLDQFTILFSDAVFEMNDVEQTEAMVRRYAMEYGHRLSPNVIRGYDLMNYLIYHHSQSDCSPMYQCIPKANKWKGMSQNFHYSEHKDNQSLFILRLEGRSISKIYEY